MKPIIYKDLAEPPIQEKAWDHGGCRCVTCRLQTNLTNKNHTEEEKKKNKEHWSVASHGREFCKSTSLHGLHYVGEPDRHFIERFFWLGAFLVALVTAAVVIHSLWEDRGRRPVIVTISTNPLPVTSIPFPAITLCNMNNARASVAKTIIQPSVRDPASEHERILLRDACGNVSANDRTTTGTAGGDFLYKDDRIDQRSNNNNGEREEPMSWDVIRDFIIKVNEPCHELLLLCQWGGSTKSCSDLFNTVLTDEGLCCVFNRVPLGRLFRDPRHLPDLNITFPYPSMDWTPGKSYPPDTPQETLPWRPLGAGKHLGLTIVLDIETDNYFCSSTASAGLKFPSRLVHLVAEKMHQNTCHSCEHLMYCFCRQILDTSIYYFQMLLHNPVESPKMSSFGFAISPGTENFVVIQPNLVHASNSIRQATVDKRQCYFLNERRLRFYRTYTKHNCALECEANFTLHRCGCVQYFMPKDSTTRICGKADDACADIATAEVELHHYEEVSTEDENIEESTVGSVSSQCHCLPGCNELTFTSDVTSSALVDTFPANLKYPISNKRTNNLTVFKENVVIIHFHFMDMQVTSFDKTERTANLEFLANMGGLLGLFHGFSILSLVEVLYYLSLRLFCVLRNRRRRRQAAAIVPQPPQVWPRVYRGVIPQHDYPLTRRHFLH